MGFSGVRAVCFIGFGRVQILLFRVEGIGFRVSGF